MGKTLSEIQEFREQMSDRTKFVEARATAQGLLSSQELVHVDASLDDEAVYGTPDWPEYQVGDIRFVIMGTIREEASDG